MKFLQLLACAIALALLSACDQGADKEQHQDHREAGENHAHGAEEAENENAVRLSAAQRDQADIAVAPLRPRRIDYRHYAPGEVSANGYTSYQVTPRTDSVVVRRHAVLGEHVQAGQPLVTLRSEAVAEAQSDYQRSANEWRRVQSIGRKTVGDKRFVSARSAFYAASGRLAAFGLSEKAIAALEQQSPDRAGEYTLVAPGAGVVLADDFHQGQRVADGDALLSLASEGELWVEARLSPDNLLQLSRDSLALVQVAGEEFPARVVQEAHAIDPRTRTRVVRLLVDNRSHRLHPGMFADVYFLLKTPEPVLALPESALIRATDGDWQVFVARDDGEFVPQEVELGPAIGRWRPVTNLSAGTSVVMRGAFFVQSQAAKSGFDPHNH